MRRKEIHPGEAGRRVLELAATGRRGYGMPATSGPRGGPRMALASLKQSTAKWYNRHVADTVKNLRRQVRRAVRHPGLALAYRGFQRAVERHDWPDAHRRLAPLAAAAERAGDTRLLAEMAFSAERLGEHELSTQWAMTNARLTGARAPTDWQGEDLRDATLLIRFMESEKQGLAVGLNMAGTVAEAARGAARTILVVERRLVPVFARTLPGVDVRAFPAEVQPTAGTRLVTANALTLKAVLGSSPPAVAARFLPLRADAAEAARLRAQYQAGRALPVVGLSWWSSHFGKDLPDIGLWAGLVRSTPAIFVSLQYGEVAADLAALRAAAPDRFLVDESVDQMVDMDRFAAQLGALDAVVTISNTGAHLAGGMGVPTQLIRDDWFRRAWPVRSGHTPWYPHIQVLGKDGRNWATVFEQLRAALTERLQRRG